MAYVIEHVAAPPVYIEQAPPPVVIQAQPAVAMIQQPGPLVIQAPLKSIPAPTRCNFCQQQIVTMTRPLNGCCTWTVFGTLLVLCMWPCCLIPLFVKSCKDIEHTCPQCRNVIYVYKRM